MNNFENLVILHFDLVEKAYNPRSLGFSMYIIGDVSELYFYKINASFDLRKLDNQKQYFKVISYYKKNTNISLEKYNEYNFENYFKDKKIIIFSIEDFESIRDIKEKVIYKLVENLGFDDWVDSICVGKTTSVTKDKQEKPLLLHKKFIEELKNIVIELKDDKEYKIFNSIFEKKKLEKSLVKKDFPNIPHKVEKI